MLRLSQHLVGQNPELEEVIPKDLPVSAKEWTIWLSEARTAAALKRQTGAMPSIWPIGLAFPSWSAMGFWKLSDPCARSRGNISPIDFSSK